jgi:putative FmdB family regulatory protein
MPTYSYRCDQCEGHFELFFHIRDYKEKPKCLLCKSSKTHRDYITDAQSISSSVKKSDGELSTIGDLANRNRDRMSDNHKRELSIKHNEYKDNFDMKLPKGMSRLKNKKTKNRWYEK